MRQAYDYWQDQPGSCSPDFPNQEKVKAPKGNPQEPRCPNLTTVESISIPRNTSPLPPQSLTQFSGTLPPVITEVTEMATLTKDYSTGNRAIPPGGEVHRTRVGLQVVQMQRWLGHRQSIHIIHRCGQNKFDRLDVGHTRKPRVQTDQGPGPESHIKSRDSPVQGYTSLAKERGREPLRAVLLEGTASCVIHPTKLMVQKHSCISLGFHTALVLGMA